MERAKEIERYEPYIDNPPYHDAVAAMDVEKDGRYVLASVYDADVSALLDRVKSLELENEALRSRIMEASSPEALAGPDDAKS